MKTRNICSGEGGVLAERKKRTRGSVPALPADTYEISLPLVVGVRVGHVGRHVRRRHDRVIGVAR